MTDGPAATVGEIMAIPFERPRDRSIMKLPATKSAQPDYQFSGAYANQSACKIAS